VKIKDQLKTNVFELDEELKDKGRFVKYVRMDNVGENAFIKGLVKRSI
jgi:hypothetical protein